MKKLCDENNNWPSSATIYRWISNNEEFRNRYAQAKRSQIEVLVDEIIDITTDSPHTYTDDNGNIRCDAAILRVKVDTRKWLASKLLPKVYGDRLHHDATIRMLSHEEALKLLE